MLLRFSQKLVLNYFRSSNRGPVFYSEYSSFKSSILTLAMDLWASTEHRIRYKKDVEISEEDNRSLMECAIAAAELDKRLADIYHRVQNSDMED